MKQLVKATNSSNVGVMSRTVMALVLLGGLAAAVPGAADQPVAAAAPAEHASNDRPIEIKTEGPNLWHLLTRSRLVHMVLVDRPTGVYVELLPFNYQGVSSPFADNNNLSLEINPGTPQVRVIKLNKEGAGGRLISAEPLPATMAFDAALYMDEGTHYHRLRFRFPGKP